ncbi:Rossmann-like and DUF2520 domain-containing protein [Pontibacter sp. SGAir0037]|uniref:Rossmann-like and DUF2520 domain-containing protein n=1 Tax=Pontibacter sp. SGAir0037 TaxID=2571030 RepID=UPI0010CCE2E8|nr:Rossmann-like and DUF2520 domain-containing protein [Pontibacter sp. SGAir0037]QCR23681.1 DUF2520 domain-containing protein [Pontibacter sp. SGAir0037]
MKIALVGAGNVAGHLAKALEKMGHEVAAVYSRTRSHSEDLAHQLANATATESLNFLSYDLDLAVIAVSDTAIASVAKQLEVKPGTIVCHTSGSQPLAILAAVAGARTGVLYPLQTFSRSKAVDFSQTPILIEAEDEATLQQLQQLAKTLSPIVHQVSSLLRKHLHLSAVFACNFTNHLLGISRELLSEANLPIELLHPLIQETIAKAMQQDPFQVQTGPAVRHDQNVIEEHLAMLHHHPAYKELYLKLTQSIQAKHSAANSSKIL